MAERDELGRTLALARQALHGPAAMKERLRAQLVAQPLVQRAAPGSEPVLGARTPAAASASRAWLRAGRRLLARRFALGTVTLLVGVGFGAGFWLGRQPLEQRTAGRAEVTPPASTSLGAAARTSAAHPTASDLEAPAAHPSSSGGAQAKPSNAAAPLVTSRVGAATTPRRARAAIEPSDDALMREVALLERIDRAIRSGEANLALALLTELDQTAPMPALRHERAAARVLARCVAARDGSASARQQARTDAERFLARSARSVYADRIRSACALEGSGTQERTPIEEPGRVGH